MARMGFSSKGWELILAGIGFLISIDEKKDWINAYYRFIIKKILKKFAREEEYEQFEELYGV